MAKIFMSYRRADSAAISGRIYDRLVARFKRRNVFKDVDTIPAGVNFGDYIHQAIQECAVALVVIGHGWLDARAEDGTRRLDDPADWVRAEIETALTLGVPIIPLLVEGAEMPHATNLPESLRPLVTLNSLPVRNDPDFAHDMERVLAAVDQIVSQAKPGLFHRGALPQSTEKPEALPDVSAPPKTASPVSASRAPMRRNVLLAAVAAIVVVASLALLLTQGNALGFFGPNSAATQTAARTTQAALSKTQVAMSASATASQVAASATAAAHFPLTVPRPGPGCDTGWSQLDWVWVSQTQSLFCSATSGYSRLTAPACNPVCAREFDFNLDHAAITVPDTFTISIQISHLARDETVSISIPVNQRGLLYSISFDTDSGTYYATGFTCPSDTSALCSGSLAVNATHTLAFHFAGENITAELDGRQIGSDTAATNLTPDEVDFGLAATIPGVAVQVDFSNFHIGQ